MPSRFALAPAPPHPEARIPLLDRTWRFNAAAALYALPSAVLVWAALQASGAEPIRAVLLGVSLVSTVLAANAGLKGLTLDRIRPAAVIFSADGLVFPTSRFLRGLVLVRLPWDELRDVALRDAGVLEAVDIETWSGRTLTLPAELYPPTWGAPRIAEAIQQEAARR